MAGHNCAEGLRAEGGFERNSHDGGDHRALRKGEITRVRSVDDKVKMTGAYLIVPGEIDTKKAATPP